MNKVITITVALLVMICFSPLHAEQSETSPPANVSEQAKQLQTEIDRLSKIADQSQADLAKLKQQLQKLQPATTSEESQAESEEVKEEPATEATKIPASAGGKYLLLPDISLNAQSVGKLSNDQRDGDRNSIVLREAELAVQGYAYPGVKADAFITMPKEDGSHASVEETYVTFLHAGKGLTVKVGKLHVPFGRTNMQHSHSWLTITPPLVLQNFVSGDSLGGQGLALSYLLPTGSNLFGQLDVGTWTGDGLNAKDVPDPSTQILGGTGAGFSDRFHTARLWLSKAVQENGELEVGGSFARGGGAPAFLLTNHDADGNLTINGNVAVTGLDLSYRRFGTGASRWLYRGEWLTHHQDTAAGSSTSHGYYLFTNYRADSYRDYGVRYDWSGFSTTSGQHESAVSFILTNQLTEQTYLRWQATTGSRPGESSYRELVAQLVWGVGPHTHNLE